MVKILNNIGTIFLKTKEIDKAEDYFLQSFNIFK